MVGKQNKARTTTGVGGRGERRREFPLDCDLCQQSFPKSVNKDLLCTYYVPGPCSSGAQPGDETGISATNTYVTKYKWRGALRKERSFEGLCLAPHCLSTW